MASLEDSIYWSAQQYCAGGVIRESGVKSEKFGEKGCGKREELDVPLVWYPSFGEVRAVVSLS